MSRQLKARAAKILLYQCISLSGAHSSHLWCTESHSVLPHSQAALGPSFQNPSSSHQSTETSSRRTREERKWIREPKKAGRCTPLRTPLIACLGRRQLLSLPTSQCLHRMQWKNNHCSQTPHRAALPNCTDLIYILTQISELRHGTYYSSKLPSDAAGDGLWTIPLLLSILHSSTILELPLGMEIPVFQLRMLLN